MAIKSSDSLRMISAIRRALLRGKDSGALAAAICRIAVETGGYSMAWFGRAYGNGDGGVLQREASYPQTEGVDISLAIKSFRNHSPLLITDPGVLELPDEWRHKNIRNGFDCVIMIPLVDGDKVAAALCLFSTTPPDCETDCFAELAEDIAVTMWGENSDTPQAAISGKDPKRDLLEAIPHGFIECGLDGVITFANAAFLKMMEIPDGETANGKNVWEYIAEGRERERYREYMRMVATHRPEPAPRYAKGITKNGVAKELVIDWSYKTSEDGGLTGFISTLTDITGRRMAEEERNRLIQALEQVAEAIVITTADGKIIYVNATFTKVTGYTREDVHGRNPRILKSGRHDKQFYKVLWDTLRQGKVWEGRFINKKKNGELYEELATISPVFDDNGEIVNYVSVMRDITHESMLNKAKDYFTSITSHELRSPLVKLQLAKMLVSGFVSGGKWDEEMGVQLRKALEESYNALDRIASATTLFSNLSLETLRHNQAHVYIQSDLLVCCEVASFLMDRNKRKIDMSVDVSALPKGATILGDQSMVQRAIEEALSNAIKYTPDGKKVFVTGRLEDSMAVIEIRDEGIGIPHLKQEQVFVPYFSLEDPLNHSTSQYKFKGGGIGLGLTIARLIMQYHGGRMELSSPGEDMGATAILRFPLADQPTG